MLMLSFEGICCKALPRGLYVEHAVKVAKEELTLECDYEYERQSQIRMAEYLHGDAAWNVPVGPHIHCSPRHMMLFNSINEGSQHFR